MNRKSKMKWRDLDPRVLKLLRVCQLCLLTMALLVIPVFAANVAENGANFILDNIYWVAVVAIIIQIAVCLVKRNLAGALILFVVGAIVVVLITQPGILKTQGENLTGILGLTS